MARKLNARQKRILANSVAKTCQELPYEIYEQVNKINCYENMDNDIDRFLTEKHAAQRIRG